MKNDNLAWLTVSLPKPLRERSRRVCKKYSVSTTHLIRQGLDQQVRCLEEVTTVDERTAKETKLKGRQLRTLESAKPTANEHRIDDAVIDSNPVDDDPLAPLYVEHARKIFAVLDRPLDKRMRAQEAIIAIRRAAERAAPLTYKPMLDGEILVALEREVLRLRESAPKQPTLLADVLPPPPEAPSPLMQRFARAVENAISRTIDPGRVRTAGDA